MPEFGRLPNDTPATVILSSAAYGYLYNLQGDVVTLVNTGGTKVVEYTYDAWGTPISKTGTLASTLGTVQPFRYRGYVYDEETQLYYLRSRYYRPAWGRFIKYVGRVMDSGYEHRMKYHRSTKNLLPAYRVSGLTYTEARGLEEIGMVECHTLKPGQAGSNQIHGISIHNPKGEQYMFDALSYLENKAEQRLLNILQ